MFLYLNLDLLYNILDYMESLYVAGGSNEYNYYIHSPFYKKSIWIGQDTIRNYDHITFKWCWTNTKGPNTNIMSSSFSFSSEKKIIFNHSNKISKETILKNYLIIKNLEFLENDMRIY